MNIEKTMYYQSISQGKRYFLLSLVLIFAICICSNTVTAQVSLTTLGTPYTENFDTLPATGTATVTNNGTLPGFFFARTGSGTSIAANDGSSNAGNLYSYGTTGSNERALGTIGSGGAGSFFNGVSFINNTGSTIGSLVVSYVGEQWRNSAAAAQTVSFSYVINNPPSFTGSLAQFQAAGTAVPTLDFTSPITGGAAGALDGNAAANRLLRRETLRGINLPVGAEIVLRFSDPDHTGSDHGLAIDDLSVTPIGPTAATVSISGRVMISRKPGSMRALVTLTDSAGNSQAVLAGRTGEYSFGNIAAGETYILNVSAKGHSFAPQIITANEDLTQVNFAPLQ